MTKPTRPNFAVLIDADNIPAQHAPVIIKEISRFADPGLRRVYGDWSSGHLANWLAQARDLGLTAQQSTANTHRKNATDIDLVIDAMDILHSGRFDGFVLVSSDSDFTALASRIREQGLDVIGVGEEKKSAMSFRNVCTRFMLIDDLEKAPQPLPNVTVTNPKRTPKDAVSLILTAMEKMDRVEGWYPLSRLGAAIRADVQGFDSRKYGKAKLSGLVACLPQFQTRKTDAGIQVRRLH